MQSGKNSVLDNLFLKKRGKKYDVAIMYSGGKDSAYLVHLLRDVYKLRVKAVIVDNGFEHDLMWKNPIDFLIENNVDYYVLKPDRKYFMLLYKMLICDNELFKQRKVNHICFICNNILWANVINYAVHNDIPFVASGLSLAQLNSGRAKPLIPSEKANAIAEKSSRAIFQNAYIAMQKSKYYLENQTFKEYIREINISYKKISTVYPYIYHEVNVRDQIGKLINMGWKTPNNEEINSYVSSGCMIMEYIIKELDKVGFIEMNEREEAKLMIETGMLDKRFIDITEKDIMDNIINLKHPLFNELGIREYLLGWCKLHNKDFMC